MIRGKPKQPNAKIAAHASGDSQAADAFPGVTDQAKKAIIDCSHSKNGVAEHVGAYWWTHPGAVFARYK